MRIAIFLAFFVGCSDDRPQEGPADGGPDAAPEDAGADAAPDSGADAGGCTSSEVRCADATAREICDDAGAWTTDACPLGTACDAGACVATCALAAAADAALGCVHFAVDLDQVEPSCALCDADQTCDLDTNHCLPNAAGEPVALSIANPNATRATVTVENLANGAVTEHAVEPGVVEVAVLERLDVDGTGRTSNAFAITSDVPVVVHQLDPDPAGYGNDGSMLLPDHALGTEYVVLDWPTGPYGLTSEPLGSDLNVGAHAQVVMVAPGDATVTVTPSADVRAGGSVAALSAGVAAVFDLVGGEVLSLETEPEDRADLSGTRIESTQPVAVFVAHECAFVPDETTPGCGHLEEQLPPVSRWGTRILGTKTRARGTEPDVWRVVASRDDTLVRVDPVIAGVDGATLSAGESLEFESAAAFELDASQPILAARFTVGPGAVGVEPRCPLDFGACDAGACAGALECRDDRCNLPCDRAADCSLAPGAVCGAEGFCIFEGVGMPTLAFEVPAELHRDSLFVATPSGWVESWIAIVLPTGVEARVDDVAIDAGDFVAVGTSGSSIAWSTAASGLGRIDADAPATAAAHGYGCGSGYAFTPAWGPASK